MTPRAAYASDPAQSRGRRHGDGGATGERDAFQRDRDRIVHSIAFRRLRHKTQVFVAPDGDHFRVRLTHSLEVAQIGRVIARALGLNEDLTEALCLAHDLGHPPFGHAGEDALQATMAAAGGFDHNAHALRILTRLETPYPRWDGLNLSWETLEGLAKHNGPVSTPSWALAEVDAEYPLDLTRWPSLEAQVAAIADDIAYNNHDVDDGLRSGLFSLDALLAVPIAARTWAGVVARFPDVPAGRLLPELVRDQIGGMVADVLAETRARIATAGIDEAADVRAAGRALCGFSGAMAAEVAGLKAFLHAHMYHHPRQAEIADAARTVLVGLFAAYRADPAILPEEWGRALPDGEPQRSRHLADFIAGMTDRYAVARHVELIGPTGLPEGF